MLRKLLKTTTLLILIIVGIFLTPNINAQTEVVSIIREDGTGDYTSLSAWEAGEQRDLVALNEIATARIEGTWTNPDTTAVTIDGWTTGENNYIKIYTTPEARHGGVWDTSAYRLESTQGWVNILEINELYTQVVGLQIKRDGGAGGRAAVYLNGANSLVDKTIIQAPGTSVDSDGILFNADDCENRYSNEKYESY